MGHSEPKPAGDLKSGVCHLRSLTGLRFIAAFVVFASHVQHFMFPEVRLVPLGGPAVSFFFVLSGFILTYVYSDRLNVRGIPRFWFSRWARLWPLHIACLLIAIWLLHAPPGSQTDGRNSIPSLIAQALMLHSWLPIQHWFVDFNSVSWSISTELFFYTMFPLMLLGKRKYFWIKLVLVFVASAGCLFYWRYLYNTGSMPAWMDGVSIVIAFPLVRLAEFALGMGTCMLMQRWKMPFASAPSPSRIQYLKDSFLEFFAVALIVVTWLIMVKTRITNFFFSSPEIGYVFGIWLRVASGLFFYAFAILIFASRRGLLGQIMSSRLAVWLGEISFAFYLIHQIVIVRVNYQSLNDWQFAFVSFVIALMASALLYRIVEMPCRNALLAIYDRKQGWFGKSTAGLRETLTTRMGWFHVGVLVLLIGILWLRPVDQLNRQKSAELSRDTPPHLRNLTFHEEAILIGFEAKRVERGILLRMAWDRQRSWSRFRFLHICDPNGVILTQGPLEREAFGRADPNQPFVEEVVLPKRKLKGAHYVALGFWSEELSTARVNSNRAEMNGHRIKLFDIADVK